VYRGRKSVKQEACASWRGVGKTDKGDKITTYFQYFREYFSVWNVSHHINRSTKVRENSSSELRNLHRHIWGIYENDNALQKTNKDRANNLLPPSFRQVSAKFRQVWRKIFDIVSEKGSPHIFLLRTAKFTPHHDFLSCASRRKI
jgi:hypothetical protein